MVTYNIYCVLYKSIFIWSSICPMFFGKNPCIYTLQVIVIRYQYSKLKFEETTTTSIIVMARIICLQLPLQRVSGVCDLLRIISSVRPYWGGYLIDHYSHSSWSWKVVWNFWKFGWFCFRRKRHHFVMYDSLPWLLVCEIGN